MNKIQEQLVELEVKRQKLLAQQAKQRANKTFVCGCGKRHKIKDCDAIQTYWNHSYEGGWRPGEMQIVCPDTNNKNRVLFLSNYSVDWSKRYDYQYNLEKQFVRIYTPLFKSVIDDYEQDKRGWWNNEYFDKNHEFFDLSVGDQ